MTIVLGVSHEGFGESCLFFCSPYFMLLSLYTVPCSYYVHITNCVSIEKIRYMQF